MTNGSVVGGRYRLSKRLHLDGDGELWWATDERLSRAVMLRLVADGSDLSSVVKASARLVHPNVVRVLDAGWEGPASFVVTEPALGLDLAEVVRRSGPLRPVEAAIVGAQAADVLAEAARVGVRMAPLEPRSIWVSPEGVTKLPVPLGVEPRPRSRRRPPCPSPEPGPEDVRALVSAVAGVDGRLVSRHRAPAPASVPSWLQSMAGSCRVGVGEPSGGEPCGAEGGRVAALEAVRDELLGYASLAGRRVPEALARLALVVDGSARPAVAERARRRGAERAGARARDQARASRRRRGPLLGVGIVVAVLAVGALATGASSEADHAGRDRTPSSPTFTQPPRATAEVPAASEAVSGSLPLDTAQAFDPPPGNGQENQALLGAVTQADPEQPWHTDIYANRRFGNLTSGVGVILELAEPAQVQRVTFVTTTLGWRGEVFVAGSSQPATLAGWGSPVAAIPTVRHDEVQIPLGGVRAQRVLIWFDHLGPAREVSVEDAQVFGRPALG